jgi:hypothetical protein
MRAGILPEIDAVTTLEDAAASQPIKDAKTFWLRILIHCSYSHGLR